MNRTPSVSEPEVNCDPGSYDAESERSDPAVQWANLIVWTLVGLLATVLGIVLIPLHASGGFLIPISPVIVLIANFLLPKLLLTGTGWTGTRFIPAAIWAIVALVGSTPTSDGDLLISGSSHSSAVGLAYLGLGALGAVLGIIFAGSPLRRLRRAAQP